MKRALLVTVGIGHNDSNSLAHGILSSIRSNRPDSILFFGSEKSLKTIEALKKQYADLMGEELDSYEFVELSNVDDFFCCYEAIARKIKDLPDYEIVIDYTSGTKTMSVSAAICALLYRATPSVVAGRRGSNGVVTSGAESTRQENFFLAYDEILLDRALNAFDLYRFGEAMSCLGDMVGLEEEKRGYKTLFEAYDLWDRFEYEKAFDKLKSVEHEDEQVNKNKSFLGKLKNNQDNSNLILAELLNNTERRIKEGKYDDAVARLYRVIELLAQIKLREYGIDPGSVDVNKLRESGLDETAISEYEERRDDGGKIRVPLRLGYTLLSCLGDDLGKKFFDDRRLQDLLGRRNYSILAHGLDPVGEEDSRELFEKAIEHAKELYGNIERLREDGQFPKLQG